MIVQSKSQLTAFGGLCLVNKHLQSFGVKEFINKSFGNRGKGANYSYSDIILTQAYTVFCGGSSIENVNYIREECLNYLPGISVPSADTILRSNKELSVPCSFIETKSNNENKINVNTKMNDILIDSAIKFKQIIPEDTSLIYDFDHQFIPTEKYDATYSYKKRKGYFPGVATISNIPVYVEGRNGNCNVKTNQLSTHKSVLEALSEKGIKPKYARMDCGSYIKEVTDYFQEERILFSIRASSSETLLLSAGNCDHWEKCRINNQDLEVSSFKYIFGKHEHRIVVYRTITNKGQLSAFTKDAKKYMFLITNDKVISNEEAIRFYNNRGNSERVFDIQNNDFNWKKMPHSSLEENTVFLIIRAIIHTGLVHEI
ncbi:IS1380 family transposase [Halosquirtibacter laminarini]|uniref:IS1380 family transposase n=1 Tax=Halosquirtibacter laminarini TaxID=3374600 RepID=A0AC61NBA8_9BACT|nr:IS1380 family transposase [Prolixibacteraceae bacterium]